MAASRKFLSFGIKVPHAQFVAASAGIDVRQITRDALDCRICDVLQPNSPVKFVE
jgi:hypothetical protein